MTDDRARIFLYSTRDTFSYVVLIGNRRITQSKRLNPVHRMRTRIQALTESVSEVSGTVVKTVEILWCRHDRAKTIDFEKIEWWHTNGWKAKNGRYIQFSNEWMYFYALCARFEDVLITDFRADIYPEYVHIINQLSNLPYKGEVRTDFECDDTGHEIVPKDYFKVFVNAVIQDRRTKESGWGAIVVDANGRKRELYESGDHTIDDELELKAFVRCLRYARKRGAKRIGLYTDMKGILSAYGNMDTYMWRSVNYSFTPYKHQELWDEAWALVQGFEQVVVVSLGGIERFKTCRDRVMALAEMGLHQ